MVFLDESANMGQQFNFSLQHGSKAEKRILAFSLAWSIDNLTTLEKGLPLHFTQSIFGPGSTYSSG